MQCVGCNAELERCSELLSSEGDYCRHHHALERERGKSLKEKQERVTLLLRQECRRGQLYRALLYELKCYTSLMEIRHPDFPPAETALAPLRLCLERLTQQEANALPEQLREGHIERLRGEKFLEISAQAHRQRSVEVMVIRRFLERYVTGTISLRYLTLPCVIQQCEISRETFALSLLFCLLQEELRAGHWDVVSPFGVRVIKEFQTLEQVSALMSNETLSRLRKMVLTSTEKVQKVLALLSSISEEPRFYGIANLSARFFPVCLTAQEHEEIESGRKGEIDEPKLIRILSLLQRKAKE